jgi:hypothetical protein
MDNLGWLREGMVADVVVFPPSKDPLTNIFFSQDVKYVVKDGKMYDALTLTRIRPGEQDTPLPRGPRLEALVVGCEEDTRVGATYMGACVDLTPTTTTTTTTTTPHTAEAQQTTTPHISSSPSPKAKAAAVAAIAGEFLPLLPPVVVPRSQGGGTEARRTFDLILSDLILSHLI